MPVAPEFDYREVSEHLRFKPEVVSLGREMVVAYQPFGVAIDTDQYIDKFVGDHPDRGAIITTIKNTGITRRHHNLPPLSRREHGDIINRQQVKVGAQVTRAAIEANGWQDRIDLLIVSTSAPLVDDFAEQVAERAGLSGVETRLYCLACNGAIAAMHDILQSGDYNNGRVV